VTAGLHWFAVTDDPRSTHQGWLPPAATPGPDPFGTAPERQAPASEPFGPAAEPPRPPLLRRILGPLAVAGAILLKFGKAALLLLPKAKVLTTSASMLVSIAAYALIWGWKFAVGFVLLLFVHEMGHVIQLRREGVKDVSAPLFIPFLGAVVWARTLGGNAVAEARVGLAGPILGSIGAALCIPLYHATGNELFKALAFTGFFLNLFNLLPFGFLDGARAAAAMSPWMWLVGVFGMVVLVLTYPNPIIILIALIGLFETYRRFKALRSGGEEVRRYYAIPKRTRFIVAGVYLGLIALLVLGMDATHVERTLSDT
jgi:Zn-dependent protease